MSLPSFNFLPRWLAAGPALPVDGWELRWPDLRSRFYVRHLWLPLLAFLVAMVVLMGLHGDFLIADAVYAAEGHAWSLQSGHLTQDVLHAAGRQASKNAWFALILVLGVALVTPQGRPWRRPLVYLLVATALSTAAVGVLKRWTHMDCPWDLLRYGGHKTYYGLFSLRPALSRASGCFPAGHASAGYAWVALYFVFGAACPRLRGWGLGIPLAIGLVFGIAQQLRGAHFLSHDLASLMVCWLLALVLARLMRVDRHPSLAVTA